ncbi:hypothetical protein POV27_06670 [Aureisphaera galaxeae]|nr:hypothetical protein [Aureisphaera galaxeae]MDC8003727.1 hypothetical protein [Aureisphaera galaxeae]
MKYRCYNCKTIQDIKKDIEGELVMEMKTDVEEIVEKCPNCGASNTLKP